MRPENYVNKFRKWTEKRRVFHPVPNHHVANLKKHFLVKINTKKGKRVTWCFVERFPVAEKLAEIREVAKPAMILESPFKRAI